MSSSPEALPVGTMRGRLGSGRSNVAVGHFEAPGASGLNENREVGLRNVVGVRCDVRPILEIGADGAANPAVDHGMRNMDALRAQLPRGELGETAQSEFAMAKRDESANPFRLTVAPVSGIAPLRRGTIRIAAC